MLKIIIKGQVFIVNIVFLGFFLINYQSVFADEALIHEDRILSTFKECEVCPEMVIIPSGKINYEELKPIGSKSKFREIIIKQPFAMSIFEITWSEWLLCVKKRVCKKIPSDQGWGKNNLPIINVSWFDALDYISYLNQIK